MALSATASARVQQLSEVQRGPVGRLSHLRGERPGEGIGPRQGPLVRRWEDAPGTASAAGLAPLCAAPGTYVHDH
jgi:hypothetical protein